MRHKLAFIKNPQRTVQSLHRVRRGGDEQVRTFAVGLAHQAAGKVERLCNASEKLDLGHGKNSNHERQHKVREQRHRAAC